MAALVAAPRAQTIPVRSVYNWIHGTRDAERAFAFYHDVFGVELTRSPFAGAPPANAPPEAIRPASQAGSDPLVWDLTNTHGSRFRTVFMHAANAPFGLELSEFFDIARDDRTPNPWDPGAVTLIVAVRDLDLVLRALKARSAPIVTLGGNPVETPKGRALLVRDPDGCLVEVRQAPAVAIAAAQRSGTVIDMSVALTVGQRARALAFYQTLLGLTATGTRTANAAERRLNGLDGGTLTQTTLSVTAGSVQFVLSEYAVPAAATPPKPFAWKLQDVGSPQLQLEVAGLDALIDRTKAAGYRFLSVGAKPIQRAFGRFVFAIDPDGVLVEFVEPARR